MKRFILLAVAIFSTLTLSAQYRPIVKHIVDGEADKAAEKYDKLDYKDQSKAPASYALTKALWLNMKENAKCDHIAAYKTFIEAYVAISASPDTPKILKGTELTVDSIKLMLENDSAQQLFFIDTESFYDDYIVFAESTAHNQLDEIKRRYELCGYRNVVEKNTISGYDAFLEKFPTTPHRDDIVARRTDLYFADAMANTSESKCEEFIALYPTYARLDEVKAHLANLRYKRVMESKNYADLEWFTATHPDYSEIDSVWQALADIDYPKLGEDIEAMRRFTARYPKATQTPGVAKIVRVADICATADLKGIFAYIEEEGYDRNYYRFAQAIARTHNITILTKDTREVSLVKFLDDNLKIGFLDKEGNIAIAPTFESSYSSNYNPLNFTNEELLPTEFKKGRDLAVAQLNGKWGIIALDGNFVVKPTYMMTGFRDNDAVALKRVDESEGVVEYTMDAFDSTGKLIEQNRTEWQEYCDVEEESWPVDDWFDEGISVVSTDNYEYRVYNNQGKLIAHTYRFSKATDDYLFFFWKDYWEKMYFINRKGETFTATFQELGINQVVGNIITALTNDSSQINLVDLDKREFILRELYYVGSINDGRLCVSNKEYKYGYLNEKLEKVIDYKYTYASDFERGVAAVGDDTGYYLIDVDGNKISRTYDNLKPLYYAPGLYIATQGGLNGIIDLNDEVVAPLTHPKAQGIYSIYPTLNNGIVTWDEGITSRLYDME